ncbi:MAG: helix-turn-helix transcriptional regulator [Spirochaetaceae bacterium]|nr:helix-turn-helix transcriptional regulator [Spirochaetaceae bacterium]
MEFNEKLRSLRARAGLTQERLADELCVSRVTVSKWESGRGYPNIESLRLMARTLSVSIDDLLSGDELLSVAETQARESSGGLLAVAFGVLDVMMALILVLPLFGDEVGGRVESVALPRVVGMPPDIVAACYVAVVSTAAFGVLQLALQNLASPAWRRLRLPASAGLSALALLFFIMTRQPYVCAFSLCLLLLKGILLARRR